MADRVGQQLGNYKLVRLLGQGGFAEVYEGEHIVLKQKRAIKILYTTLTEKESRGFRIEAERLARLSHPHIVPIVDFDEREGFPYLVMEYAPHGSLRNRHPKGTRLPLPTIIDYTKQIASALQYIHDQKLIHRDVKPANMLIGANNQVLLSDIGLAEVAHSEQSRLTQIIGGTPHYMAPEHFKGKAEPASDQYSLGVVIYEWLSGKLPFEEGDFMQLGYQHSYETPRSLREMAPNIPEGIENVVMIALAKDSKKRFASVQAFATALENENKPKTSQPFSSRPMLPQSQQFTQQPLMISKKEAPVQPQSVLSQSIDKDALYRAGFVARSNGELDRAATLWQQIIDIDSNYGNGTLANQLQTLQSQIRTRYTEQLRQQAKQARQSKQLAEEEIAWSNLLQLNPEDKEAKTRLQKLEEEQKQLNVATLLQKAKEARQEGQWQEEESALQTLLELTPENSEVKNKLETYYQRLSRSARMKGDWTQEITTLEKLKSFFPIKTIKEGMDDRSYIKKLLSKFGFPLEKLLTIAKTNQQHEWMYNNVSLLIQDGNYNAAQELLSDLWQRAPYYGDPEHLAKILNIKVKRRLSPETTYFVSLSLIFVSLFFIFIDTLIITSTTDATQGFFVFMFFLAIFILFTAFYALYIIHS